jgi:hypothetical protein
VNTTTSTLGATFVQAAQLLAAHLADHRLREPASLLVMTRAGQSELKAQVHSDTVPKIAAELLAWADTLPMVTVQAWRSPSGDRVHLSIASTLTGPAGAVELDVYGGADDGPVLFADLAAGDQRTASLEHLRIWAASASDATGGVA